MGGGAEPRTVATLALSVGGYRSQPRESQRDVVYLGWPIAPSYMSPNAGGGGGELRGLSQWVQPGTWSPNKLWRSNSIFDLCTVCSSFAVKFFYLYLNLTLLLRCYYVVITLLFLVSLMGKPGRDVSRPSSIPSRILSTRTGLFAR